jgi:hypothetical protein
VSELLDVCCGPKALSRSALQSVGRGLAVLMLMALSAHVARAQKVSVEFDKAADFSKYHTFAIRDGELNSRNPALNGELTKKNIETDIEGALTAKGLMRVTGPSDLNVRFTLGSARRVEAEAYPAGWYGMGTRIVRVPFAEGTLVIDLRDPATRSLVWRGIATDDQQDPSKLGGKIDNMVKKSLAKYPPKK